MCREPKFRFLVVTVLLAPAASLAVELEGETVMVTVTETVALMDLRADIRCDILLYVRQNIDAVFGLVTDGAQCITHSFNGNGRKEILYIQGIHPFCRKVHGCSINVGPTWDKPEDIFVRLPCVLNMKTEPFLDGF